MELPLVSLIITCYNLEKYVQDAIISLINQQTQYSYEIIVIDDCSTDSSVDKILQIQDNRIKFIKHNINKGAAESINEGFRLAKGKYVGRLDADDVWNPDYLETTVSILESHPNIGLVYGDVEIINEFNEIIDKHCKIPDYNNLSNKEVAKEIIKDYLICAPAVLARKEAWDLSLPLAPKTLFCDFEMALSIAIQYQIYHIDKIVAKYRVHSANMHISSLKNKKAEISIFETINKFKQKKPFIFTKVEWNTIIQSRYLLLGDLYFGINDKKNAIRCYLYSGKQLWKSSKGHQRRLFFAFIPTKLYDKIKKAYYNIKYNK